MIIMALITFIIYFEKKMFVVNIFNLKYLILTLLILVIKCLVFNVIMLLILILKYWFVFYSLKVVLLVFL